MIEQLNKLMQDVNAITIDGPSGIHFKRVLRELITLMIEKENNPPQQWPFIPKLKDYMTEKEWNELID